MKILVVTQKSPFPAVDGGSVAFLNGLECLYDVCDEVHLLSLNPNEKKDIKQDWPLWFKQNYHADSYTIDTSHSILKFLKSIVSPYAYILFRFVNRSVAIKINQIIEQNQIDCIVFESIYTGVYIDFIDNKKRKTILKVHNVEHSIWNDLAKRSSIFHRLAIQLATRKLKINEIAISKKVHQTVAFTLADAQFFKPFSTSIDVIGMHTPLAEIAIEKVKSINHHSFFHLAAMDWLPNIEALDWLINEVWPLFKNQCSEAQLFVAGKNMPDRFKKLEDKNVYVKEAKVASEFIQENGIMLVPLFSGSGIRVKIIEGMSLGRCIICTSKSLVGIDATNHSNILVADTAHDFAEKMIACYQNPDLVSEIGRQAAIFARNHFSKNHITQKWRLLLNNLNSEA